MKCLNPQHKLLAKPERTDNTKKSANKAHHKPMLRFWHPNEEFEGWNKAEPRLSATTYTKTETKWKNPNEIERFGLFKAGIGMYCFCLLDDDNSMLKPGAVVAIPWVFSPHFTMSAQETMKCRAATPTSIRKKTNVAETMQLTHPNLRDLRGWPQTSTD